MIKKIKEFDWREFLQDGFLILILLVLLFFILGRSFLFLNYIRMLITYQDLNSNEVVVEKLQSNGRENVLSKDGISILKSTYDDNTMSVYDDHIVIDEKEFIDLVPARKGWFTLEVYGIDLNGDVYNISELEELGFNVHLGLSYDSLNGRDIIITNEKSAIFYSENTGKLELFSFGNLKQSYEFMSKTKYRGSEDNVAFFLTPNGEVTEIIIGKNKWKVGKTFSNIQEVVFTKEGKACFVERGIEINPRKIVSKGSTPQLE